MRQETIKVQIPDGWELVTEEIVIHRGQRENDVSFAYPEIKLRKVEEWKQPDFLKPGWIAMDEDGSWWFYKNDEPRIHLHRWRNNSRPNQIDDFNWTPPACNDWKKSKRRID